MTHFNSTAGNHQIRTESKENQMNLQSQARSANQENTLVKTLNPFAFLTTASRVALAFGFVVMMAASSAMAIPVTVINPSFEDDVYPDAGFSFTDPITGWTRSGSQVTTWNPNATGYTQVGVIPDGDQVLAIDPSGTYLTQVTSELLSAGSTYTLTVGIGNRIGQTFGGYDIQLRAGGVILAQDINSVSPVDDQFLDASFSFVAPASHPQLGQPVEIRLLRAGSSDRTEFDLVRLDVEAPPVPEPGSLMIFTLLGSLFGRRMLRKRQRSAAGE